MEGGFLKRYRIVILVAVLLICGIQFMSYKLGQKKHLRFYERVIVKAAYPLEAAGTFVVDRIFRVWNGYFYLVGLQRQVETLKKENARLATQAAAAEELRLENERLRELLKFKRASNYKTVAARVISLGLSPYFHVVRIDKGRDDGIAVGMPVVTAKGVVGQVVNAGSWQSEVLTLVDRSSAIDVLCQRTRSRGLLAGSGFRDKLEFKYLSKFEDIAKGDLLITSGLDGVYPKGLPVGTVRRAERDIHGLFYKKTDVKPAVDFDRLEEVLVIITADLKSSSNSTGKEKMENR